MKNKKIVLKKKAEIYSYRPKYEMKKILWEFNPNDSDLNPKWSIPHGDDISPRYHTLKLNVDTGEIYTAKGFKYFGRLTKKELLRLNSDVKFLEIKAKAKNRRQVTNNKEMNEKFQMELEYIPVRYYSIKTQKRFKV